MRNEYVGSMSLGRWLGVQVRLHISFMLAAVFLVYLFLREPLGEYTAHGWILIGVWFTSVLLHEAGHLIAGARLGYRPEAVVLTPLGGITNLGPRVEPQREIAYALSGPLANLAALLSSSCLLVALGDVSLVQLLHPFRPQGMLRVDNLGMSALQMTFWVNWCLVLVNLLPAHPLDGGRILRALLWGSRGGRRALHLLTRSGQLSAVGLLLVACLPGVSVASDPLPAAFPLAVLAVYLLFQARQPFSPSDEEEPGEELFGYDFSQGYTSLERKVDPPAPRPGPLGRWLQRRREERRRRLEEIEQAEEQRADAILESLHVHGPDSLSAEDRALLVRVSARYRARLGSNG